MEDVETTPKKCVMCHVLTQHSHTRTAFSSVVGHSVHILHQWLQQTLVHVAVGVHLIRPQIYGVAELWRIFCAGECR